MVSKKKPLLFDHVPRSADQLIYVGVVQHLLMMATSSGSNSRKRLFCGHCKEYVSKSLFYKHKQLYYDEKEKKWCKERVIDCTSASNFVFGKLT